jgi:hypothetical protein
MRLARPRLLSLNLAGNSRPHFVRQQTNKPGFVSDSALPREPVGGGALPLSPTKQTAYRYDVGLKLIVRLVCTDTGRPFIM